MRYSKQLMSIIKSLHTCSSLLNFYKETRHLFKAFQMHLNKSPKTLSIISKWFDRSMLFPKAKSISQKNQPSPSLKKTFSLF